MSTGGATDSQKLSMNSLKTIVVLPRLLQQTRGRVSRKSPAYHIDDRADGLERGAFMHEALLLKGVGSLPTSFGTVEVANKRISVALDWGFGGAWAAADPRHVYIKCHNGNARTDSWSTNGPAFLAVMLEPTCRKLSPGTTG